MTNKYYKRSKISEAKFRHLIKCFSLDLTATETAGLVGISLRSTTDIFDKLRRKIAHWCEEAEHLHDTIEARKSDPNIDAATEKKTGENTVFGIIQQQDKVYTEVVPEKAKNTLTGVEHGKINPENVLYLNGSCNYDGLVHVGCSKYFRVQNRNGEPASCNGITNCPPFWNFAKRRLAQFNGVPKQKFYFYLKETQFRFNHRNQDLYRLLLRRLRDDPF